MIDVHRILVGAFVVGSILTIIGMIILAAQLGDDGEDLP